MSYLFHRTHRKLMIIDERIVFIGGVNLHRSSRLWNDLVVKIQGRLVSHAIQSFIRSYNSAGGIDESLRVKKKDIILSQMNDWIIDHSPFKKFFELQKLYTEHIHKAKKRIILITPYFIPKRWLSAALHEAVLRGVQVEVLIPRKTDHFLIDRVNYFYMNRLAKLGIVFCLGNKMNHAKGMIIDNDKGMLGSQNLDSLSFDFNSEIGVFFTDQEAVGKLIDIAEKWKQD